MINAKGWLTPILFLCASIIIADASARAESYVAGQFGLTVPDRFRHVNESGLTLSDLGLKNSVLYGAKLGHYMDTLKYFGVETEAYTTTPHIKQQVVTISGIPGNGLLTGAHLRMTTWAFNVVYRYPGKTVQPYAGWGWGCFLRKAPMPVGPASRLHQA